MNSIAEPTTVGVIGAGIVGLSVAVQLQRDGYRVTVIDRDEPMQACSAGNAGYLSEANIFPPAAPDMLLQLPKLLLANDGPLVIRPAYAPKMMSWGRHALSVVKGDVRAMVTRTLASMTVQAYAMIETLATYAGAAQLLSRDGGLVAFKNAQALDKKCELLNVWHRHGIEVHRLSDAAIQALEPALSREIVGGLFFANSGRCSNPRRLGLIYAEHLVRNGGEVVRDQVNGVSSQSDGGVIVRGAIEDRRFANVVVCAGFWSEELLHSHFKSIPIASERGYHLMLPNAGLSLKRPVVFGEPHFAATPMDEGLRLAGTAEFASADAPPNMQRAEMLLRLARQYLAPIDETGAKPWMGVRPSLPDGLPAIGTVPGQPGLHYAFGHAHNGLTLSAVTAKCVSAQLQRAAAPIDLTPFDLMRFERGYFSSKQPRATNAL